MVAPLQFRACRSEENRWLPTILYKAVRRERLSEKGSPVLQIFVASFFAIPNRLCCEQGQERAKNEACDEVYIGKLPTDHAE